MRWLLLLVLTMLSLLSLADAGRFAHHWPARAAPVQTANKQANLKTQEVIKQSQARLQKVTAKTQPHKKKP